MRLSSSSRPTNDVSEARSIGGAGWSGVCAAPSPRKIARWTSCRGWDGSAPSSSPNRSRILAKTTRASGDLSAAARARISWPVTRSRNGIAALSASSSPISSADAPLARSASTRSQSTSIRASSKRNDETHGVRRIPRVDQRLPSPHLKRGAQPVCCHVGVAAGQGGPSRLGGQLELGQVGVATHQAVAGRHLLDEPCIPQGTTETRNQGLQGIRGLARHLTVEPDGLLELACRHRARRVDREPDQEPPYPSPRDGDEPFAGAHLYRAEHGDLHALKPARHHRPDDRFHLRLRARPRLPTVQDDGGSAFG